LIFRSLAPAWKKRATVLGPVKDAFAPPSAVAFGHP
jgi:hypothetical protein